ncbi:MAG: hypothetical protein COW73_05320 [Nitrospirae bacterium CG18_big_fil_WC_8_21_14_2_50_70_55]|nr:hypothetical protein [Deltaproteobacteria bacterium]OIP67392.1 MAG: hypothetical protein AUK30_00730 [Nitrospirae bacterium CG2_30_70_394]PIQ05634.1 MAG: hypothetical protein COW73_05320 [Nitrospirae bacterium CG18_big_fil_WC_8_21_14_2_50_70_55]PIU78914.1 MAG: hypothetical protein COS73_05705 [Nitrospirae bacterium CG06_land_8_20_14_3_00_70_43]PIW82883.1 MAG: hypothetical protein COZ96_06420 [Nitrospirae bacterium CG_4_8_14_3_um_filter_70_85]PJB96624.1 MAG: hypothetical protein CO080_02665 
MMRPLLALPLALLLGAATAVADDLAAEILHLQQRWAQVAYQQPPDGRAASFDALAADTHALAERYPNRAEPLIWEGVVRASEAGATGGLEALKLAKEARRLLLAAEKIDPTALDGDIYVTLGALYTQAPGWPVGFGDKQEAERYLKRALELHPDHIDPNYFYADWLLRRRRYADAIPYLERALGAPPRLGRPVADAGRRALVEEALARARRK